VVFVAICLAVTTIVIGGFIVIDICWHCPARRAATAWARFCGIFWPAFARYNL